MLRSTRIPRNRRAPGSAMSCASLTSMALSPKHDRLKRHAPRIGSELLAQRPYHRIHDKLRLDAAAGPDLIDQRVTIDQPARKNPRVRYLLFHPDHGDADLAKTRLDERL